ncbi:MAG TPA: dihydrodipicolinate reductase C-terminal domain-containing protein [Gemmatimonadaceae bacterium]|nr:dihydrodipicolinate reductase C-terminal domain-containing protein [Gemmatimonadaceae bacterium]
MTRHIAIVGMGKMGRAIAELAPARGWEVVARLDEPHVKDGITRDMLGGADVAVEFTVPDAAPKNIRAIVAAGCPVVVGTTGWYNLFDDVKHDVNVSGGALLTATNFSLGVNIFEQIATTAAALLAKVPGFEAHLVETHHSAKKDAPSGTAHTLAQSTSAAWGKPIPITSVRTGSVPGTHEFIFDAPFEQIHLEHIARDRRVFAEGALVAARWLIGRRGVFTMKDVLSSPK